MNIIKKLGALVLAGALIFNVAGCGKTGSEANTTSKLDEIKKSGKIVMGTCADYPPYEFHVLKDGKDEISGFDIEIAKQIASDLGVELEIKDMKFEGLLPALKAGKVDFIASGMSATEERKKSVDFSNPYYTDISTLVVSGTYKDKVKSVEDLKGLKLGVQKASVQEGIAKDKAKDATIKPLGKITDVMMELENGKIDAAIVTKPVAQSFAKKNKNIFLVGYDFETTADDSVSIAIDKGNEELVKSINETIEKLESEKKIEKFIQDAQILSDKNAE